MMRGPTCNPPRARGSSFHRGALALLLVSLLNTACGGGGATPTAAPAKPTEAAKPAAASPAASPSPAAAPSPAASPSPAAAAAPVTGQAAKPGGLAPAASPAASPSPSPAVVAKPTGPPGSDIVLPPGYQVTEFASGFTSAIAMNFAPNGDLYVLNSGFPSFQVGEKPLPIEIHRVSPNGQTTMVYTNAGGGGLEGVALGIFPMDEDNVFVNDSKGLRRVRQNGSVDLVLEMPNQGDHNGDHIVMGRDGKLYWGQGSATNSGVVGSDNELLTGWLKNNPQHHDIPCRDVVLSGKNYTDQDVLSNDPNATTETGAFLPFGTRATPGQVVQGRVPCATSVLRANPDGSGLELVAWGFRNPFGLAFSPEDSPLGGALIVTNNGGDVRGSRPVENDADDLYVVREGGWYGWPDYLDELPITEPRFTPAGQPCCHELVTQSPGREQALAAAVHFEKGSSADGVDFSRSDDFGFRNDAFVAVWGSLGYGQNRPELPGFNVARVHWEPGAGGGAAAATSTVFARNRVQGPASQTGQNGFEHPVDVKFSADGRTMYVLDFGVVGSPNTGRVWAIRKS